MPLSGNSFVDSGCLVSLGPCWNFGFPDYVGQQESPELAYTFTPKRNFTNPSIATFLPLLVVAGLLFTLVAITGRSREQMAASGYSAMYLW